MAAPTGGRFWRPGNMRAVWVTTLSSVTSPTAVQIAAGENITDQLAGINGLGFENQPINVPDLGSPAQKQIPGADQLTAGDLEIYEEKTTNPLFSTFAKGEQGWLVIAPTKAGTVAAADIVEVWPCEVASRSRAYGTDTKGATFMVKLTVTDNPEQEAVVA